MNNEIPVPVFAGKNCFFIQPTSIRPWRTVGNYIHSQGCFFLNWRHVATYFWNNNFKGRNLIVKFLGFISNTDTSSILTILFNYAINQSLFACEKILLGLIKWLILINANMFRRETCYFMSHIYHKYNICTLLRSLQIGILLVNREIQ